MLGEGEDCKTDDRGIRKFVIMNVWVMLDCVAAGCTAKVFIFSVHSQLKFTISTD